MSTLPISGRDTAGLAVLDRPVDLQSPFVGEMLGVQLVERAVAAPVLAGPASIQGRDAVVVVIADRPGEIASAFDPETLALRLVERAAVTVNDGTVAGIAVGLVDVGRVVVLQNDHVPPGRAKKLVLLGAAWV